MTTMSRSYSEMMQLPTFKERFQYLQMKGNVGESTFGHERILNQTLYGSQEWKRTRNKIISRDLGRDLAVEGREIPKGCRLLIHHINPITSQMILDRDPAIFDPENLVVVSHRTHEAIHFGDEKLLPEEEPVERKPNDTCPWRN